MANQFSHYSFHKGKLGGTAGYVFPFFTPLPGLFPTDEYNDYVPAGFLKCQGQILLANQYRSLAQIIGVGDSCIYKKDGVELQNADENGNGGQIQLPDLGSKYIAGSLNPGLYSNSETTDPGTDRAGISTEISSAGNTIDFFYEGEFRVPSRPLGLTGNIVAVNPAGYTDEESLGEGNFLPHGHTSTFSMGRRINLNCQGVNNGTWNFNPFSLTSPCFNQGTVPGCNQTTPFGAQWTNIGVEEFGTLEGTTHDHLGVLPRILSESKSASLAESLVPASSIITTVNIRTNTPVKMDDFAPKYILCEYLIKY
jgi:hypothetical protein